MRRIQSVLLALTLFAVVASCGEVSSDPRYALVVTIPHKTYSAGDTVTFRLRNISKHDIGFSTCPLSLEELKDGVWSRSTHQPNESSIVCPLMTTVLPHGETDSAFFVLGSDVPVGTYRILIMPGGSNDDGRPIPALYTPVFSVIKVE